MQYACPICPHKIAQPLARQKMYRHLLGHGVSEKTARKVAEEIPLPKPEGTPCD
jgi:hypothetical protein